MSGYIQLQNAIDVLLRVRHDPEAAFAALIAPALHALVQMGPADRSGAAQGLRMAADVCDWLENTTGPEAAEAIRDVVRQLQEFGLPGASAGQRGQYPDAQQQLAPRRIG